MNFNKIDINNWDRKEFFNLYFSDVPCSYSMCVNIDITGLIKEIKRKDLKFFPTFLYGITKLVNAHKEFRMSIDSEGNIGYFDYLSPSYTVFNKTNQTFTNIWTDYNDDFNVFYNNYVEDIKLYSQKSGLNAKPINQDNLFNVSCIPWTSFTGFNLNLQKGYKYLLPIFTMGKYANNSDNIVLPLAIQVHHSVCDGFHISRFINELQNWCDSFSLNN